MMTEQYVGYVMHGAAPHGPSTIGMGAGAAGIGTAGIGAAGIGSTLGAVGPMPAQAADDRTTARMQMQRNITVNSLVASLPRTSYYELGQK